MNKLQTSLVLVLSLHTFTCFAAAIEKDKSRKLKSLQEDIQQLQSSIQGASDEKTYLIKELEENEQNASQMISRLDQLNQDISSKLQDIESLQQQQHQSQQLLQSQKEKLSQQILASYISGRSDYLKLLLNQEDPKRIGRVLAYYDYHNRQQTLSIQDTTREISEISQLEQSIREENELLIALKDKQETQLADLEHSRLMRQSIIENLDSFIAEQGLELQRLQTQQQELKKLLENIDESVSSGIEFFEDIAPFDTLRGTLEWPVKGKVAHYFGSPKKGANLDWQGMLIEAPGGTEVKAISTGKVVFADWFKNLGLLIIIEHGDGYMSLYGHNQSLKKIQGDWVLPGEPIAQVGDTGGQSRSALYFELRHRGKPLNPVRWCKK